MSLLTKKIMLDHLDLIIGINTSLEQLDENYTIFNLSMNKKVVRSSQHINIINVTYLFHF